MNFIFYCSSNAMNNLTLKKQKVCSLCYRHKEDPAQGRWCVDGQALSIWVDTSSLATGMSLVYDGALVEGACWLRSDKDSQHINLMEHDAIIKGINLAILWKTTTLHLFTDSACVHKWISDTLTGTARV